MSLRKKSNILAKPLYSEISNSLIMMYNYDVYQPAVFEEALRSLSSAASRVLHLSGSARTCPVRAYRMDFGYG